MKIKKINVMRGPNYWSNYRKNLIVLTLDLEEFAETPSNKIPGFNERLKTLIPTLYEHHCSVSAEGGFFERLDKGTMLGHVIEHVALELQTLAGMECGYGRTRESQTKNVYNVVFSFQIEEAGILSAKIATDIVETLAMDRSYRYLEDDIADLKEIYASKRLGPSTESIINEATDRNIPTTILNEKMIMLGQGCNQKIISATMTDKTSCIGTDIVADKNLTKEILESQYIPVPNGKTISSIDDLDYCIEKIGFPLVIKPRFGNHGRGITTNINSVDKAIQAFELARNISRSVVIEKYVAGDDYRFLLINYKLVAVAKRLPAKITGDGISTIKELINKVNADPRRGKHHENVLTTIKVDEATISILVENNFTLESILPAGEDLALKYTANISTGGISMDVTDDVHPMNVFMAERIARLMQLDVCGIDVIAKDISKPLSLEHGAILEVNAAPGFRMHLEPSIGIRRNVARQFIDMLYPNPASARIPIVAVTGTNGKTTTVRLIAHTMSQLNKKVGMSTTEGLYIDRQLIHAGDCSGPKSAEDILRDPLVDFAVLECARGGIIRSGLGFDKCSTSIVTNISEDHLGIGDIHTIEELAKVKSVVPHSTLPEGYAILNADDPLVYDMHHDLDCQIAFFAMTKSDLLNAHCTKGQLGCFQENDVIYLWDNKELIKVAKMSAVPLTLNGKLECMKPNILAAVLALWTNGVSLGDIKNGLMSFYPSVENLPGRFNIFEFQGTKVMLDYAHNEDAYKHLKNYFAQTPAKHKIGIIAGTGDRRNTDIEKTGFYAGKIFDEIIIRHDIDPRGRTNEEITNLLLNGIEQANSKAIVRIISNEFEALDYAINTAQPGTLIWHFPDSVLRTINFLKLKQINGPVVSPTKGEFHATQG